MDDSGGLKLEENGRNIARLDEVLARATITCALSAAVALVAAATFVWAGARPHNHPESGREPVALIAGETVVRPWVSIEAAKAAALHALKAALHAE